MEHIQSIDEAKYFISEISKKNKTAAHNCWAYIYGDRGEIFHCSDAGEPGGTAGRPMLNMLQKHNMTHIAAVVTRHFGGVKLGVKGLIEAYSLSVQNTIELRRLKKQIKRVKICVDVSYEFNDTLLNLIKNFIIEIEKTDYTDKITHTFTIALKNSKTIQKILSQYHSQGMLQFKFIESQ